MLVSRAIVCGYKHKRFSCAASLLTCAPDPSISHTATILIVLLLRIRHVGLGLTRWITKSCYRSVGEDVAQLIRRHAAPTRLELTASLVTK